MKLMSYREATYSDKIKFFNATIEELFHEKAPELLNIKYQNLFTGGMHPVIGDGDILTLGCPGYLVL